ncbi:hypothetical protein CWI62_27300, partial [Escherichia coli]
GRFVAGGRGPGVVSPPFLAGGAPAPRFIITGGAVGRYEYGLLPGAIFWGVIVGDFFFFLFFTSPSPP